MNKERTPPPLPPLKQWHHKAIIIGTTLALLVGYGMALTLPPQAFITLTVHSAALIALTALAILGIAIIFLIQLIHDRSEIRSFIAKEAKKELTERLKSEEAKQKLEIALLQGQKLQAIGTLAGGIAHDFNNILYAIKGFAEMSQEDIEKNTLVYNNLGRVLEAVQRAQDLVARILAFSSRPRHADVSPVPIQSIVEGVLGLLKPTIPASVTIQLVASLPHDCLILGNQTQLHQVIVNLILNAVDAMEDEGTITIKLTRIFSDVPHQKAGHYCQIDIDDTGHGMDESTMKRIFEPFYTTKEVGKGTGLGLATVHSIIKQHHGEITVSSQLGRGTIFTLLLPEYETTNQEVTHG